MLHSSSPIYTNKRGNGSSLSGASWDHSCRRKGLRKTVRTQGKSEVRGKGLTRGSSIIKPALGAPIPALVLIDSAYRHLFIIANVARERWPKFFGLFQLLFHISNLLNKRKKGTQDIIQNNKGSLKVKLGRHFLSQQMCTGQIFRLWVLMVDLLF